MSVFCATTHGPPESKSANLNFPVSLAFSEGAYVSANLTDSDEHKADTPMKDSSWLRGR